MIDIHSHILPEVDDGSKSIKESIAMAKQYVENGIYKVIATPHYIEDTNSKTADENRGILENLKDVLRAEGIELEVYLGNEIYILPDILNNLSNGKVSTLNGSRYVLIESAMFDIPINIDNIIYELCLKGYIPIIAHPERNLKVQQNPNILYGLIMSGALTQINLPSLEGRYGKESRETAVVLLNHNMVHFVGTDAHSPRTRSPKIKRGLEILKGIVDRDEFYKLIELNGEAVLDDKNISIEEPIKYEKDKRIFSILKKKISIF